LIAAQRAAGEALAGTLNEQLKPSALLPGLSAAKAALDAVIQTTSNAAAMISMVSLMVRSLPDNATSDLANFILSPKPIRAEGNKFGPVLA
jgi:hypothetical protein